MGRNGYMKSMKLTGEYEFTKDGVIIEGQLHDTQIAHLRQELRPLGHIEMYCGETRTELGPMYKVPSPYLFQAWKESGLLTSKTIAESLNIKGNNVNHRTTVANDLCTAGIMYSRGLGSMLVLETTYRIYMSVTKPIMNFNVAWIYSYTKDDGTFKVDLKGVINRHMLTMILGRAAQFAKFLDGPIAKIAQDSSNLNVNMRSGNPFEEGRFNANS